MDHPAVIQSLIVVLCWAIGFVLVLASFLMVRAGLIVTQDLLHQTEREPDHVDA